ncbi:hypothetical protein GGS23DRAFT_598406 [Durotheca rogersii]|uniref:uncharacterized protein n=1 Tax=Durotheca rogersii TaxID=419775 RepID=UPI00221EC094|nr:uncharacterized protein GGS23DRAFT_598406 [Durotheca rogersii]KAI5861629.1 hypothetical protein GGS23DRAFT_598406 [Durotheca rogersii]
MRFLSAVVSLLLAVPCWAVVGVQNATKRELIDQKPYVKAGMIPINTTGQEAIPINNTGQEASPVSRKSILPPPHPTGHGTGAHALAGIKPENTPDILPRFPTLSLDLGPVTLNLSANFGGSDLSIQPSFRDGLVVYNYGRDSGGPSVTSPIDEYGSPPEPTAIPPGGYGYQYPTSTQQSTVTATVTTTTTVYGSITQTVYVQPQTPSPTASLTTSTQSSVSVTAGETPSVNATVIVTSSAKPTFTDPFQPSSTAPEPVVNLAGSTKKANYFLLFASALIATLGPSILSLLYGMGWLATSGNAQMDRNIAGFHKHVTSKEQSVRLDTKYAPGQSDKPDAIFHEDHRVPAGMTV